MKKIIAMLFICAVGLQLNAQDVMTPELLWKLGRVSTVGISIDNESVIYNVRYYNVDENTCSSQMYAIPISGGEAIEIDKNNENVPSSKVSPNGQWKLTHKSVHLENITGKKMYPEYDKSDVYIYDDLMYRHWDTWSDGSYNHVFIESVDGEEEIDIMEGLPFHAPTMPFGGSEDYIWHPDGDKVLYITKAERGRNYTISTNTDIFEYDINTKKTNNLTGGMMGYDNSPSFSSKGQLAWLSMKRDGYESDKNDIVIQQADGRVTNLTAHWDGTVASYLWSSDGKSIFFIAPVGGTKQLFSVSATADERPKINQISDGQFDVRSLVGQSGNTLVVTRTDMNHASELYTLDINTGELKQLTHVNDDIYDSISLSKIEKRMIKTSDNKDMVTWVIYPPNFDPNKKYPTLLYCQGGPQGALSQFYSFRWNFQLMAAQGYVVVAPNRRGMPGHGVAWNEQISKDYGGQNMRDYLAAIDELAKEEYVDQERLGAVGASYGGYSVFYLAGIHENRFKSFISHDGLFNLQSMYGTTEELFFVNWDLGGPYWEKTNEAAQKTYSDFNPINLVSKWNTPILIFQGGKDYRVPIGQGLEAFQAAQLRGIKSRLVYLPEENHWVLSAQNGIVWQREFYRWLKETL